MKNSEAKGKVKKMTYISNKMFAVLLFIFCIVIGTNFAFGKTKISKDGFGDNLSKAEESAIRSFIIPFFNALKTGDTIAINDFLSDKLSRKKRMITSSNEYSDFLKNYYSGSTFKIVNIKKAEDSKVYVTYTVKFRNDSEGEFSFFLEPFNLDLKSGNNNRQNIIKRSKDYKIHF